MESVKLWSCIMFSLAELKNHTKECISRVLLTSLRYALTELLFFKILPGVLMWTSEDRTPLFLSFAHDHR